MCELFFRPRARSLIYQLPNPIPVRVPPDVDGLARFIIDRGPGTHLEWVVQIIGGPNAQTSWTFDNTSIRFNTSITDGWTDMRPFTQEECDRFRFLLGA